MTRITVKSGNKLISTFLYYSRTSVAPLLMARLPRLFRTRPLVARKSPLAADFGYLIVIFFFILKFI